MEPSSPSSSLATTGSPGEFWVLSFFESIEDAAKRVARSARSFTADRFGRDTFDDGGAAIVVSDSFTSAASDFDSAGPFDSGIMDVSESVRDLFDAVGDCTSALVDIVALEECIIKGATNIMVSLNMDMVVYQIH